MLLKIKREGNSDCCTKVNLSLKMAQMDKKKITTPTHNYKVKSLL